MALLLPICIDFYTVSASRHTCQGRTRAVIIGGGGGWIGDVYMVAMTTIMLLYTHEIENVLYHTTRSMHNTVGPKSGLILYCVPNVLFLTSVVTLVSRGNDWSCSCPLIGGFTGLEGNIGCQILGGFCPPNLNIGGAGAPPAPTPLHACSSY